MCVASLPGSRGKEANVCAVKTTAVRISGIKPACMVGPLTISLAWVGFEFFFSHWSSVDP